MIVTKAEGEKRSFLGIEFLVLAVGKDSMVTKMQYRPGESVPLHAHPNEQSGYVVSGRYQLRYLSYDQELGTGDSYSIPADVEHHLEVIEAGEVIDFFTPPREDYR